MRLAQKLFAPMEFKSLLIWFLYLIAPPLLQNGN